MVGQSAGIVCQGLRVAYGGVVAVDDVSFRVAAGEVFGLLGPNGAGKTSTIRALTTIVAPTAGVAEVGGIPVSDHGRVRRRIGVLPESNGYPGAQTGLGYLCFYGQLFGISRDEAARRAGDLLSRMGLGENARPIATYSRGMRQRLGLCRAMINDPDVLFLDEPTLGLDPAGKKDILAELVDAAATRGAAVLLCTHLLDEVERVCDRVAILAGGVSLAEGTVAEVIARAGVGGVARVTVDPADTPAATAAIAAELPVSGVRYDNTHPGRLEVDQPTEAEENRLLAVLLAAGVQVRSFELDRASLDDAFLALTAGLDLRAEEAA